MRIPRARRPLARLAGTLALLLLAGACGGPDRADADRAAQPVDDGRPLYPDGYRSCRGKPSADIGLLEARIVERPSVDRAVVEVAWTKGHRGHGHALELVLPEAAWIVDGEPIVRLPMLERTGRVRWTVGFETGRDLDAVVRCAAEMGDDHPPCAAETYVRLHGPVEAP